MRGWFSRRFIANVATVDGFMHALHVGIPMVGWLQAGCRVRFLSRLLGLSGVLVRSGVQAGWVLVWGAGCWLGAVWLGAGRWYSVRWWCGKGCWSGVGCRVLDG